MPPFYWITLLVGIQGQAKTDTPALVQAKSSQQHGHNFETVRMAVFEHQAYRYVCIMLCFYRDNNIFNEESCH